ncbi:MAG TPA: type II secretion system major pseudopilin GspG, partial [Planctomycetaceae bacterium]
THARNKRAGFTLMEVLIVLAILAVIIGLVVPNLMKGRDRANNDAAKVQVKAVEDALGMYALDHDGDYPASISVLMTNPGGDTKWNGPYFKGNKSPVDPWNNPIQYQSPGQHHSDGSPDVWSNGKDKTSNTADDLNNWGT